MSEQDAQLPVLSLGYKRTDSNTVFASYAVTFLQSTQLHMSPLLEQNRPDWPRKVCPDLKHLGNPRNWKGSNRIMLMGDYSLE
ncbi:hypothetical protein BaRGS_00019326 [Batillaria attramentaria]|uniref:Uncharacterized protein n=1 Tax=Batillaria attramentaria TaxID=370345 RepID=A0ABD0KQD4_9CAEN